MNLNWHTVKHSLLLLLVIFAMWTIVFLLTLGLTYAVQDYLHTLLELAQLVDPPIPLP